MPGRARRAARPDGQRVRSISAVACRLQRCRVRNDRAWPCVAPGDAEALMDRERADGVARHEQSSTSFATQTVKSRRLFRRGALFAAAVALGAVHAPAAETSESGWQTPAS